MTNSRADHGGSAHAADRTESQPRRDRADSLANLAHGKNALLRHVASARYRPGPVAVSTSGDDEPDLPIWAHSHGSGSRRDPRSPLLG